MVSPQGDKADEIGHLCSAISGDKGLNDQEHTGRSHRGASVSQLWIQAIYDFFIDPRRDKNDCRLNV